MIPEISIVIPAYNEAENIPLVVEAVGQAVKGLSYEVILVDDGSTDGTLPAIEYAGEVHPNVFYVALSRNFGHQNALKAGFEHARGQCVVSLDADLQHPPDLIPQMVEKWREGYEVVYTQRREDPELSFFKRKTSSLFYRLLNFLSEVRVDPGASDYRLVDRAVADLVKGSTEHNLFLRGFFAWLGFKQYKLTYTPNPRKHGKTKYTLRKMISVGLNGITSFSIKPLRLSIFMGSLLSAGAFVYALYAIYIRVFKDIAIPGWASVLVSVLFVGGVQLLMMGVIGEYIGKLFLQSKGRPSFVVRATNVPQDAGR